MGRLASTPSRHSLERFNVSGLVRHGAYVLIVVFGQFIVL